MIGITISKPGQTHGRLLKGFENLANEQLNQKLALKNGVHLKQFTTYLHRKKKPLGLF